MSITLGAEVWAGALSSSKKQRGAENLRTSSPRASPPHQSLLAGLWVVGRLEAAPPDTPTARRRVSPPPGLRMPIEVEGYSLGRGAGGGQTPKRPATSRNLFSLFKVLFIFSCGHISNTQSKHRPVRVVCR